MTVYAATDPGITITQRVSIPPRLLSNRKVGIRPPEKNMVMAR